MNHNGGRLCGRCEAMTQSCGYRMARRAMRLPTKPPTIIEKPAGLFDNGLHKTSKGMRDMNYQITQQFERATKLKLPIQPLLVLCGVIGCLFILI